MNTTPTEQFTASMRHLGAAFNWRPSDDELRVYWSALSDLGADRLDPAIDDAIKTCRYRPKPAELRSLANEHAGQRRRYIDGEPVFDCQHCEDTGWRLVVDPHYWPNSIRPLAVTCRCDAGEAAQRIRESQRLRKVARFSDRCVAYTPGMTREQVEAWIDETRKIENHPNYTDFGAYSAEQQEVF